VLLVQLPLGAGASAWEAVKPLGELSDTDLLQESWLSGILI
jgi:hypothetical protein